MPFPGGKIAPALLLRSDLQVSQLPSANIALTAYAPTFENAPPTTFTDPSGWTLVGEWDTRDGTGIDGDLSSIDAYYTFPRGHGIYWNSAGTLLTICNASDDQLTTFTCSTPFDPETATALTADGDVNPGNAKFYLSGLAYAFLRAGDNIDRYPSSSAYAVKGQPIGGRHSTISKADIGYTGSSDGFWTAPPNLSYILWHAPDGSSPFHNFLHYITTPGGDLSAFTLQASEDIEAQEPAIGGHLSDLSKDELSFYLCKGTNGIRLVTLTTATDVSTVSYGPDRDIGSQFNSAAGQWDIDSVWIDPNNTRYVWVMGDTGSQQIQMAKFDTTT